MITSGRNIIKIENGGKVWRSINHIRSSEQNKTETSWQDLALDKVCQHPEMKPKKRSVMN